MTIKINGKNKKTTPTMKAGITFHVWKPIELLSYKVKIGNSTKEIENPISRAA